MHLNHTSKFSRKDAKLLESPSSYQHINPKSAGTADTFPSTAFRVFKTNWSLKSNEKGSTLMFTAPHRSGVLHLVHTSVAVSIHQQHYLHATLSMVLLLLLVGILCKQPQAFLSTKLLCSGREAQSHTLWMHNKKIAPRLHYITFDAIFYVACNIFKVWPTECSSLMCFKLFYVKKWS